MTIARQRLQFAFLALEPAAERVSFLSSRRRHTRLQGDWSSDVCSSDLSTALGFLERGLSAWREFIDRPDRLRCEAAPDASVNRSRAAAVRRGETETWRLPRKGRSEERRVGKSVDLGGRRIIKKKKEREM